jgi:C1A family cysteine protease
MKKMKFNKEKVRTISFGTFLIGIVLSGTTFAAEISDLDVKLTDAYKEWDQLSIEEKEESIMPSTYSVSAPESILSKYEINCVPSLLNSLLGNVNADINNNVSATVSDTKYNLADVLNMRVEHQGSTSECWAFSLIKSMETNIALTSGETELKDFSERHMDYATSKTFTDGINENGFSREVGKGGLPISGLAYLTNGEGAVLESDMPFEDNENKISLSQIDKEVNTIASEYIIFPSINKKYQKDSNGNTTSVKYYNSNGSEYTQTELNDARNMIKNYLVTKGAITTMTVGNYAQYYNNLNVFSATAYNCNDVTKIRDHAVTIVGWDDNYSKDNFAEGAKPSTDGAYIVLNSYGDSSFDNGYLYISYEDYFIENEMYGVANTSSVDYDNIYQHDFYGAVYQIGSASIGTGYYASVYKRDTSDDEILNSVGVSLSNYSNIEIYVNPTGSELNSSKWVKVGSSNGTLEPGYHRIDINPIELTESEFAIIVKQTSKDGTFYFSLEANVPGTAYECVSSENLSYISMDGTTWSNLTDLDISGLDMTKADVCVKGFTTTKSVDNNQNSEDENNKGDNNQNNNQNNDQDNNIGNNEQDNNNQNNNDQNQTEEKITSDKYTIKDDYIMNIESETTLEIFNQNIKISLDKDVTKENGEIVSEKSETIKTGMKLKLSDGTEYTLIVRGDINGDGRLSLIDISKLILHYNENKGFELTGNALKGADMNIDGIINLVDVSQMIMIYNQK